MSSSLSNLRNVLIVVAIAALVILIPGGGTGAQIALQALYLAFFMSFVWFAALMYREHRTTLYSLGDKRRAILYVAAGVLTLTLSATSRLWQTSGGQLAWLVLIGAAGYAVFAIFWAARKY
jgi:hypothetical protein